MPSDGSKCLMSTTFADVCRGEKVSHIPGIGSCYSDKRAASPDTSELTNCCWSRKIDSLLKGTAVGTVLTVEGEGSGIQTEFVAGKKDFCDPGGTLKPNEVVTSEFIHKSQNEHKGM